jgi:hypothetical protein
MAKKRDLEKEEIELVEHIRKECYKLYRKNTRGNDDWTKGVKKVFKSVSEIFGFTNRITSDPREFLWDVTWTYEIGKAWGLKLCAEIEWNGADHALYDFRKLTFSTSELKIMIFDMEWIMDDVNNTYINLYRKKLDDMLAVIPTFESQKYLFIGVRSILDREKDYTEKEVIEYFACTS